MKFGTSWCLIASLMLFAAAGCADSQPENVMQNADETAFEEYERMLKEDGMMQDEAQPDEVNPE